MSLSNFLSSNSNNSSTISNQDAIFQTQYKEYTFETNQNKEVEEKLASFWRAVGNRKPPKNDYFKLPELEACALESDEENLTEEEQSYVQQVDEKWKWTNTFCMFKKKNLYNVAVSIPSANLGGNLTYCETPGCYKAAVPKKCSICNNDKFAPKFADETCHDLVKDYGHSTEDITTLDSF